MTQHDLLLTLGAEAGEMSTPLSRETPFDGGTGGA